MKILVLNGPNLNLLGLREPKVYGKETYEDLVSLIKDKAEVLNVEVVFKQSNHEGDLIDYIQEARFDIDGIIFNPGGYTHTSVSILDALKAVQIPTVEVHISDISTREEFRKFSYVSLYAEKKIVGKGFMGYVEGLNYLVEKYGKN